MILSEEQQMVRDMARDFSREKLAPFAADWDREHRFPTEAIAEMASLGFMGMTDVEFIRVDALAYGPEAVEKSMNAANEKIAAIAA